jgi:Fe-S oxidoreductase
MWMEIDPNTRINHRRLNEAIDGMNTDVVVTACPYCLIMFDDAIRSKGLGDRIEVKDIAEILGGEQASGP